MLVASVCLLGTAAAQTEIHKCTDADGGIVFSQLPCTSEKPVESEKAVPEEEAETATTDSAIPETLTTEDSLATAETEESKSACQKPIRDAIDAIDAEIGREYTPEKAEQYKQRLLELTRKLRQC